MLLVQGAGGNLHIIGRASAKPEEIRCQKGN